MEDPPQLRIWEVASASAYKAVCSAAVAALARSFALHLRKHTLRDLVVVDTLFTPLRSFAPPQTAFKLTSFIFLNFINMFGFNAALILAAIAPSALATVYVSPLNRLALLSLRSC